jgi:hypothetical protein
MPHFSEGFSLDLPDPLAGDPELAADFFECTAVTVNQTEPLLQDLTLALRERFQNISDFFLQERNRRHV